jgi:lipopolysaccharide/colanic/teichoic acid biosynthesis glycosyltransferase
MEMCVGVLQKPMTRHHRTSSPRSGAQPEPRHRSICVIGDGSAVGATAARLTALGHRVRVRAGAAVEARELAPVDAVYLCIDLGHDLQVLREAPGALRAAWPAGRGPLVVVLGAVPIGATDWLRHLLSDRFDVAYLAAAPDERHGGPVIGVEGSRTGRRVAEIEGLAVFTLLCPRAAEMVDVAKPALAAADEQVARELTALCRELDVDPGELLDGVGLARLDTLAEPEPGVSTLVSLAELANEEAPVLRSVARRVPASQLAHVAMGRAYLAGLPERAVDLAGPSAEPPARAGRWYRATKRALDVAAAGLGLVFAGPLLALIAGLVLVDSGRPVFFRARRVGEGGREFEMLKFRSMRLDAPRTANKSETEEYATRIGGLLRTLNLDELPQLFNLLQGDMSLVGPRPEQPFIVDWYQPWQRERLDAPPGITGWWQVNMRGRNREMYQHVEYDVWYVRHRSLRLDLRILLRTPRALVRPAARPRTPRVGRAAGSRDLTDGGLTVRVLP